MKSRPSAASRPPTLLTIAESLGVSKATVSLALSGSSRISEQRRRQVQSAARRMGYKPAPAAVTLAHRKWDSAAKPVVGEIAWLNAWPQPGELRSFREFDAYWRGAERAALARGYRLVEFAIGSPAARLRLERTLANRGIRGLLLPPHPKGVEIALDWSRFATIRYGRSLASPLSNIVAHSHAQDVLEAAARIRALGYRRVGMVTSPNLQKVTLFDVGFIKAQQSWPKEERLPLLVLPPGGGADALPPLRAWMRRHRPDALFTTEGNMHAILSNIGHRVPDDLGLAATSVTDCDADSGLFQNAEEIGQIAAESVVSLLHHERFGLPEFPQEILVRGRWVEGAMLPTRKKENAPQTKARVTRLSD